MARILRGSRLGRPFQTTSRRQTTWELGPGGNTVSTITDSLSTILGAGVSPTNDGLTIVRLRGSLQAYLTAGTINVGMHCAIGAGIVSNDAFAVGVTAMPDPIADVEWKGWLYHRFFDVHSAGTFDQTDPNVSIRFEIDSKAMRKLGFNETLFFVVETVEAGAASMAVFADSRVLVKLP